MPSRPVTPELHADALPIGPRLESALAIAYRARKAVLLEGPTGLGKSDVVQHVAKRLGLATIVLDLSLLEPPDLVGLPLVDGDRTRYALPSFLPRDDGSGGILMLEELNRAERHIQQPALQLLSARTLHEYELPPGWVCFAAINPQGADYQVAGLDPALRARFLQLRVRADRASWLAWALDHQVHPAVLALARTHERVFDDVPPRTWTYVSQLLSVLTAAELREPVLLRDLVGGYLPPAWLELLLAQKETTMGGAAGLDLDVRAMLVEYGASPDGAGAQAKVRAYRDAGQTDRLDELCHRLTAILSGPEAGVLAARKQLSLTAFEALLGDLPGDRREQLQDALAYNATVLALLDVKPEDLLTNFAGSRADKRVCEWRGDPLKAHRLGLLVTGLRAHLSDPTRLPELRKSNAARASLGHFLAQLGVGAGQRWAMPLVETLQRVGVQPIRPPA
ncbi:MAG: hypothetical protein NVSMB47_16350 [Polyangiales bacterium]